MADALDPYRAKRDPAVTPEPMAQQTSGRSGPLLFCVQKHAATQLHYDLRLELDGVLKSWAVPKGPSYSVADRRYAVLVEDHPLDYVAFEGNIPKGEYGGGEVMLWDEILFPFDAALQSAADLSAVQVERAGWNLPQEIEERYVCDAGGSVTVVISNLAAGYHRDFRLGRWAVREEPIVPPKRKRRPAARKARQ